MILTLLLLIITIIGFILMKIDRDDTFIFGAILAVFGLCLLITSLIIIILVHATANNEIHKNKVEYEGLCKRYDIIKSEYEDVSKSDVSRICQTTIISDITGWNIKVYNTKYWSENLWTNWFNPKKVADNLYYISLDDESEVQKVRNKE